ncbi:MAG: phosphatase PAP2 family protein [Chitinophagales bacterium]|nr:phosphatase PAP2 family protein [Chitinophagales bacterium]
MKNKILLITIVTSLAIVAGCKKEILPGMEFTSYTYSSIDEDGGNWKTIYLTSPTQVVVNAPSDPTSPEYLAELSALKSTSATLTEEQKEKLDYWSTNGVIRWNEITRELMAKYFLMPAPNADGTYPWPNSAAPSAYPYYPFSSPPYASRAYAYLSAGSFDALISCWNYKYQFNRNAPSTYDASITTNLPVSTLPSYPSEDAVIAGFSRTLLTFLFPLEASYLTQLAKDQEDSRLYAGTNVTSDIVAGDSLGKKVANLFITRAKGDGMKNTLGTQAVWDSISNVWSNVGYTVWSSTEVPARQMLAPKFGLVKPWTMTTTDVTTTHRLPPPPAVGSPEFQSALDEVLDYSKNATNEEKQIAFKWDDGPSTYTPPGHWNAIACPYIHDASLNPLRSARVLAYTNMAMEDAGICVWDNKFYYFCCRPSNANPEIKTLMGVPGFPAYPSGHSGFSAAGATVLGHFFPSDAAYFMDQANEAALSRLYGCIHFRFDCDQGINLGIGVGQVAVDLAVLDGGE